MTNRAQDVAERPLTSVLKEVFKNLDNPVRQERARLVGCWPQIVGRFFSEHTKPQFSNHSRVTVWVDDSAAAYELSQRYKQTILKRLQNEFGEEKVKDVRFIVGELR